MDEGSIFKNNSAKLDGGGFVLIKSILIISHSIIYNSEAGFVGGFLSLKEESTAFINNNTVSNCFSRCGAYANVAMFSNIYINQSKIQECHGNIGTLIFLSNGFKSKISITNSLFFNNIGSDFFLLYCENSNLTITNSSFMISSEFMSLSNSYASIENVIFKNLSCTMKIKGCLGSFNERTFVIFKNFMVNYMETNSRGGVFYSSFSQLTILNSSFSMIINEGTGAILYAENSHISLNFSNCTFLKNDALKIFKSNITLDNINFSNKDSNFNLKTSVVICIDCYNLLIVHCSFSNFNSSLNGTCLYILGTNFISKYEVYNSSFMNNSASLSGAAIYQEGRVSGLLFNNKFQYLSAKVGGALVFYCSDFDSSKCFLNLISNVFSNNYASQEGGAIKWNFIPPENFLNNYFLNNSAKIYGDDVANIPIRFAINVYQDNIIFINFTENLTSLKNGLILNNTKSGDALRYDIEFCLLDYYNQTYKEFNLSMKLNIFTDIMEISNNNKGNFMQNMTICSEKNGAYIYSATTVQMNKNHSFFFDKISIVATRKCTVFLRFYSTNINLFYKHLMSTYRSIIIYFILIYFNFLRGNHPK